MNSAVVTMLARSKLLVGIVLVALVSALGFVAFHTKLAPSTCGEQDFGTNLGFETGNFDGWNGPGGETRVVSNLAHSGVYSTLVNSSSKFSSEFYQNWPLNSRCRTFLEAYVLVACLQNGGNSFAGIVLREADSVELYASAGTCPDFPAEQFGATRGQDSIFARVRTDGNYIEWSTRFPFDYSQWYRLGLSVQPGGVEFRVNDKPVHIENVTVKLVKPSFGARVEPFSKAYFDDFRFGQSSSGLLDQYPTIVSLLQVKQNWDVKGISELLEIAHRLEEC